MSEKLDNETIVCALLGEMIRELSATQSIEPALKCAARIHKMYTDDQWISVGLDLPKEDGQYLVAFTSGETRERFFNFHEKKFYRDDVNITLMVTHWMPLPNSPKDTEQLKPIDK